MVEFYCPATVKSTIDSKTTHKKSKLTQNGPKLDGVIFRRGEKLTDGNYVELRNKSRYLTRRKQLMSAFGPTKGQTRHISQLITQSCSKNKVFLFLRRLLKCVVPVELLGQHNKQILNTNLRRLTMMGCHDKLSLGQLMMDMKTSEVVWMSHIQPNSIKLHLLAKVVYWLMENYFMVVLQTFFYITDTTLFRNRLVYYRKTVWYRLRATGISSMLLSRRLELLSKSEVDKRFAERKLLGLASLRFVPKARNLRPIVNLGLKPPVQSKQKLPINKQLVNLLHILTYYKMKSPHIVGSSKFGSEEIHSAWKSYLHKIEESRNEETKLYFVKLDISTCFDTINQEKLFTIIADILQNPNKEEHFVVRKFVTLMAAEGNIRRRFRRQVCPMSDYQPDFVNFIRQQQEVEELKNTVIVDQVLSQHEFVEDLLGQLKCHLFNNVIKIGKQCYLQREGISQGSILSTILCNIYVGHMEKEILTLTSDDLLMRVVDDFLFVTPNYLHAVRFVENVFQGAPSYNLRINSGKVLTNFEYNLPEKVPLPYTKEVWFPWCGMQFHTSSLNVTMDMSRLNDIDMEDTLSFDLSKEPGNAIKSKLKFALLFKNKRHLLYMDGKINTIDNVISNCSKMFFLSALKFHCLVKHLPVKQRTDRNVSFFYRVILDVAGYFYSQVNLSTKKKSCLISFDLPRVAIIWLCVHGYTIALKSYGIYKSLIRLLNQRKLLLHRQIQKQNISLENLLQKNCLHVVPKELHVRKGY